MYVLPASHLKVHAAIEPGRAGEQSALSSILMSTGVSHRQGLAGELSNTGTGVVETAHVMSNCRGACSVKNRGNWNNLILLQRSSERPCKKRKQTPPRAK
jgi:hypothetical protein